MLMSSRPSRAYTVAGKEKKCGGGRGAGGWEETVQRSSQKSTPASSLPTTSIKKEIFLGQISISFSHMPTRAQAIKRFAASASSAVEAWTTPSCPWAFVELDVPASLPPSSPLPSHETFGDAYSSSLEPPCYSPLYLPVELITRNPSLQPVESERGGGRRGGIKGSSSLLLSDDLFYRFPRDVSSSETPLLSKKSV